MKTLTLAFLLFSATTSFAVTPPRFVMLDYIRTDMDRVFELKTSKFDKVLLDCQSFIQGITFYNKEELVHYFYIDSYQCEDVHSYLQDGKENNVTVCLEIIAQENLLRLTKSLTASECQ